MQGFLNEKKEADKVADSYFGDAEMMSEKDYKDNYATYKEKLFNDWKFPLKVSKQQKILKDWRQKLKDCKVCKENGRRKRKKTKTRKERKMIVRIVNF